jgi:hypothetical protein
MAKQSKLTELTEQKAQAELKSMSGEAFKWLLRKISTIKNPASIALGIKKEQDRYVTRPLLGKMYFFYYDPKTKSELPYYDTFPLVLVLDKYNDGFLGLNLHYLPIKYRIVFLKKLLQYARYDEDDEVKKIRITYDILDSARRLKEFRPCLKRYLYSHIKSRILTVQPAEMDVAVFLPIQRFVKEKAPTVWKESVQQIRNS